MNFYCARCDAPLPYAAGLCPSCGQVFSARVPPPDSPRHAGPGAVRWPPQRLSVTDALMRFWDGTEDLISPPILLTILGLLVIGTLVFAHWLLASQFHRIQETRTGIGEAGRAIRQWPDQTPLFLTLLALAAVSIIGYGLARRGRMRASSRLPHQAQIRSLLAREGLSLMFLFGVLVWFAGGVRAQDSLAETLSTAAGLAAASTTLDPVDADAQIPAADHIPENDVRVRIRADARAGFTAYHAGLAALKKTPGRGAEARRTAISSSLQEIDQAEDGIKHEPTSPDLVVEVRADLHQLEADRRQLLSGV